MEALECIKTRRSIRKFTEQPVTEDEVRQVVEAAAFAPSWKNPQIARSVSARLLWVFTIPPRLPRLWKSPRVRKWPRSSRSVIRHRTRRHRRVRMSIRCCDLSKSAYLEHRGSNSAVLFFSRHKVTGAHELPQAGSPLTGGSFSAPADRGTRTAAGGFAPDGRLLLLHRLTGAHELPQAGSPYPGGSFSAPAERGTRTAAGGFAPDGRGVFR